MSGFSQILFPLVPNPLPVNRTLAAQKRVQKEREEAESSAASLSAELAAASSRLNEVLGRLERLRKQEALLASRGFSLFEQGMQEEDELIGETDADSSVLSRQQAVGEAQSLGAFGVIDWDAVLGLDPLVDPDSSGGTGQAVVGSSSGS